VRERKIQTQRGEEGGSGGFEEVEEERCEEAFGEKSG
jgi:hypothetical protein